MIDVAGLELTGEDRELLRHPLVGGVILFSRNYHDLEQLAELTGTIRETAGDKCLIAVDQEGGRVQRFREGFTNLPAQARLGEAWDQNSDPNQQTTLQLARDLGLVMALEVRRGGVDFSFAPVLDLDFGLSSVIGDRALHGDPQVVGSLGLAISQGMDIAGMARVIKHFPGHGGIAPDTHTELAIDNRSWQQLQSQDLIPFQKLIDAGVQGVMLAHILYPEVDDRIAGFSSHWIGQVLRRRMGFSGAVFSDDMSMKGADQGETMPEKVQRALQCGCDWILLCNDRAEVQTVVESVPLRKDPAASARRQMMQANQRVDIATLQDSRMYRDALQRLLQF